MENITADELMRTVAIILAVFAAVITVDRVIDIVKKWKAPSADVSRKLDAHDKTINDLQNGQQVLCAGIIALLDHELHNGNADQMERARNDIMQYLQMHIGG